VVIARNEEAVIEACLRSVVDAFSEESYELIEVDSASTDRTVQIAHGFDARVICLPDSAPLRPSVGRQVGYKASRGKWILFLDGDSVLEPAWVGPAANAFRSRPEIGGAAGEMEHISTDTNNVIEHYHDPYSENGYESADYLDGSAAYTREAFEISGDHNPFLRAGEEEELGTRLRSNGFLLRRLRIPMTRHFLKHSGETVPELFRRLRRGFYLGMGQLVRYSVKYNLPIKKPFRQIRRHLQFSVLLLIGFAAILALFISHRYAYLLSWIILMLLIYGLFALRTRSLKKPAYYFLEWTLTSPTVIWGFLMTPHTEDEFPNILHS
jgi:glycosyltransferase involved in cell wall biosynthesis